MRENKANRDDTVNHAESKQNTSFIVLAFCIFFLEFSFCKKLTVIERTENEKKDGKASKENEKERENRCQLH